ncbi:MAG: winged helix-turn-helix transcriptional regulator [Desulfobacteraceae bacterium]|nr:winged helix-turn-helix transcriptional regulator [Desulfobacteraceae bacterium]MBC2755473.1 winged helix-turn-helix transcriptional regulator [Desulfobacteraceae bacterium]
MIDIVRYRTNNVDMKHEVDLIIYLISKIRENANRFIVAELKSHGLENLAPVHGDILMVLFSHNELSMKQISEFADRKKSTVTTLVEKLVTLGYARKKTDIYDNRSSIVSLTDEGKNLRGSLIEISEKLIEKAYKDMPLKERKQLVKSLKKILDNW